MIRHVRAETLFDGSGAAPLRGLLIRIEAGRIAGIAPAPAVLPSGTVEAEVIAPGFIDLQINGAADVQFNDDPTPEAVARIAAGARSGGTAHLLPTFITAPGDAYRQALAAVAEARRRHVPGVLGAHLEGPFLSPDRPGIHPANCIRPMTADDAETIAAAGPGTLVTLAPERQDAELVSRLVAAGVTVFAGHSLATAEEMETAHAAGVSGATHLWNAMPPIAGRAPGIAGRVLTDPRLYGSVIADGHHIHPLNLRLAAALMPDRLCLVTDAMCTLAGTRTGFDIAGVPVTLEDGRLTGPDGTLAGSHLAMDQAVRNMIELAGVEPGTAVAMASRNPARAVGLGHELGQVAVGMRASLTLLDGALRARRAMVDGAFPDEE